MFGNFSLFKTPFMRRDFLPGTELPPYLLCLFFHLLYFSYLFLKTMICFSGCLMSSASIQKLFCRIYSVSKCSFDEFVGEKVVSRSYSSAILGLLPPPQSSFNLLCHRLIDHNCVGLFLTSLFCLIDLYGCFCANTILS